jgi:phytoene dehydrogenase-like protein
MCGSVFAVGSQELPARVFLTYFTRKSAFKKFGFCPEGTIGIWRSLAETITVGGSEIWLRAEVRALHVDNGQVTGATIDRDGHLAEVSTTVAVSDAGPAATVALAGEDNLPEYYREAVHAADRPCAMITVNFASRDRLIDVPGMLSFARTRRLCYVANFTGTCPEMAPAGWHLYAGTSVPQPSVGQFDDTAETDLLLDDLREQIPGFGQARILSTVITRDGWPPQRAVAGSDLPNTTPIPNLWNVGDGVKEYANGGTTACAETAKLVVEQIARQYPARGTRRADR